MERITKLYLRLALAFVLLNVIFYLFISYAQKSLFYFLFFLIMSLIGLLWGVNLARRRIKLESKKQWKTPPLKSKILMVLGSVLLIVALFLSIEDSLIGVIPLVIAIILFCYSRPTKPFKLKKLSLPVIRILIGLYLIFLAVALVAFVLIGLIGSIFPDASFILEVLFFAEALIFVSLYGMIKLERWCLLVLIFFFIFLSVVWIADIAIVAITQPSFIITNLLLILINIFVIFYSVRLIKSLKVKKRKS